MTDPTDMLDDDDGPGKAVVERGFSLNRNPSVKEQMRTLLAKLETGRAQLTARHANPIVGHPVMAELCNTIEEVCTLLRKERKRQNARGQDSRELLACMERGFNSLSSARDVLALGDPLKASDVEELRADLQRTVSEFKRQSIACTLASQSLTERGRLSETAASAEYEDRIYERIKNMLAVYAPVGAMLPNANSVKYKKQAVTFAVLPVIAVFNSFIKANLQNMGFKIDLVADYPILQDQKVLGVNTKYIAQMDMERDTIVESALDQISKRTGTKYALVFDSPAASTNGFQYYWIMPERQLTKLIRITHGGATGWAFPFNLH